MKVTRHYYGNLDDQFGDLRIPNSEGPHPVAVVIHGGYWMSDVKLETIAGLAESLTKKGIATWNIEYRRVGQAGGGWPGTFTDVALATDYLPELAKSANLDLNRVVTIGHSAGGHLALWLAGRHRLPEDSEIKTSPSPFAVQGAISLAGVVDLSLMDEVLSISENVLQTKFNPVQGFIGGSPVEVPERYEQGSPIQLLPLGVPQVLIHGALDVTIPIGISQNYKKVADSMNEKVNLVEIASAEHFKLNDPNSDAWPVILKETLALLEEKIESKL